MPLVEPVGSVIRLERPELQPLRPGALRDVQQSSAYPSTRPRGIDIELINPLAFQHHHGHDHVVPRLGDPDFVAINDNARKPTTDAVVGARQSRNPRNRVVSGAEVHRRNGVSVGRYCSPNP